MTISFKPYYKWNTFNTSPKVTSPSDLFSVLNLIINGIPSIQKFKGGHWHDKTVLNLIINGIPSIQLNKIIDERLSNVLNLIINGIPSIHGNGRSR